MDTKDELKQQLDELKTSVETSAVSKATDAAKAQLTNAVKEMQSALESKNAETIQTAIKTHIGTINEGIKSLTDWRTEKDAADVLNQKAINGLLDNIKEINTNTKPKGVKSFGEAFAEELAKPENLEGIKKVSKGKTFVMEMKTVGDMSLSANLTGDSVATYNGRQAILPAQKTNLRDLIPSVHSDTGLYVTYKETTSEGAIGIQTEGSGKSQIDYDFAEVQTVNKYVAGFARFSKQMARSLPWLQSTLPRLLLRDFYKKENDYFYTSLATAATGSIITGETDDVKQLIDYIGIQMQGNFNASFALISWTQMARLNKLLYTSGYYQGSGGVLSQPDGSLRIAGVPVIPASWVKDDKVLIVDNDYVERVEVEGLRVEFFEQDANNVTENKITARIECYEEINPMLGASMIIADFGNTAS